MKGHHAQKDQTHATQATVHTSPTRAQTKCDVWEFDSQEHEESIRPARKTRSHTNTRSRGKAPSAVASEPEAAEARGEADMKTARKRARPHGMICVQFYCGCSPARGRTRHIYEFDSLCWCTEFTERCAFPCGCRVHEGGHQTAHLEILPRLCICMTAQHGIGAGSL